jgi:hypothetical protein
LIHQSPEQSSNVPVGTPDPCEATANLIELHLSCTTPRTRDVSEEEPNNHPFSEETVAISSEVLVRGLEVTFTALQRTFLAWPKRTGSTAVSRTRGKGRRRPMAYSMHDIQGIRPACHVTCSQTAFSSYRHLYVAQRSQHTHWSSTEAEVSYSANSVRYTTFSNLRARFIRRANLQIPA